MSKRPPGLGLSGLLVVLDFRMPEDSRSVEPCLVVRAVCLPSLELAAPC